MQQVNIAGNLIWAYAKLEKERAATVQQGNSVCEIAVAF